MRFVQIAAAAALAIGLAACDKATTSNPATVTRDELNPPSGLVSVTGDGQLTLRWLAKNAETDFKGFDVFVMKGKIKDLPATAYPSGADLTKGEEIPRCKDNNAIFKAFGFATDTTADCEGAAEKPDAAKTALRLHGPSMMLDDTTAGSGGAASDTEKLANIVVCDGNADTTLSLTGSVPSLGIQTCVIKKDSTGTAIANGTTYTIFVASVMGDNKNKLSWTSNFVQDTPSTVLYSNKLTVAAGMYYMFPATNFGTTLTKITADPTATPCTQDTCDVASATNVNKETTAGIYIGRDGPTLISTGKGNIFPQRAFLSVPNTGPLQIQLRGPQVYDNGSTTATAEIAGDTAKSAGYAADGQIYPIYGDEIFDIQVTNGTTVNYGKIFIGDIALKTPTDEKSDLTVPVTIIMQPTATVTDYFGSATTPTL